MTKTKAQKLRNSAREDERLAAAMATFTLSYGRDETKLEKWQKLCDDCGVERGGSITKCKALLRTVAVNMWDLIESRETGNLPVQKYKTKKALRLDLKTPSRRFPLARVKCSDDNKLLKALLVSIA